ncbi:UNVERIFIED_CONTAM: Pentatricopeptide repeat-containing protein [Sesamum radiatum]|uniref:Pentatricopeptide repeat-containing protein n=1 Tax=Sesamum radiatum TaxID=300843 RepID=A0AAW2PNE8_SESRA
MLRAKHLGTLSQSARSFFLSGSSVVQQMEVHALAPKTRLVFLEDHLEQMCKTCKHHPVIIKSFSRNDFDAKDIVHSSPPIADQFVKAGMAAVGLLSDLVNYRIPMTDGSAMVNSLQNSMVDPTKPISNVRSANMKTSKKDKVYDKPSAEPVSRSSSTSISYGEKGRANKSVSAKGVGNVSSNVSGDFVENHGITSESRDRKRPVPQRSRAYSDRFIPNTQQSKGS